MNRREFITLLGGRSVGSQRYSDLGAQVQLEQRCSAIRIRRIALADIRAGALVDGQR